MYSNHTAPDSSAEFGPLPPAYTAPRRLATHGEFREQYPGHFYDAIGRVAEILAHVKNRSGMVAVAEFRGEAEAIVRVHTDEAKAHKAAWGVA